MLSVRMQQPGRRFRSKRLRIIPVALLLGAAGAYAQTHLDIPELGDPAAKALPLSQEKRLAPVILRRLRAQLSIIEGLELNEYVSSLGNRLLAASDNNQLEFHFLLANNPQINAFATPGGIIVINSGLILATESESELVSVLAHEIAHVTQRHLARLLTTKQDMGWSNYLVAVLTALGAAYDSRLARLGAYTGAALPIERSLSYSRLFEYEADQLGMQLMAAAGYNPADMISFFQKLQSKESGGGYVPEFLRTHPLTIARISNATNRVARYQNEYQQNSDEFLFAKAWLESLTDERQVITKPEVDIDDSVSRYRLSMTLLRVGRADEAVRLLKSIQRNHRSIPVDLALAQAYLAQGETDAAVSLLEHLDKIYPERESIVSQLGKALLQAGQPRIALARLRPLTRGRHAPVVDKLVAEAAIESDVAWLGHKHLAEYYQANGRIREALEQLTLAIESPRINEPAREEIETRRKVLEKLREEFAQNR